MKYIPIESCAGCDRSSQGREYRICDRLLSRCPDAGIHPDCPLSDLPEWGLLAEGDVIREGDEVLQAGDWSAVEAWRVGGSAPKPWRLAVRRRLGGGK